MQDIVYCFPKDMSGEAFIHAHGAALDRLSEEGWSGGTGGSPGAVSLYAEHKTVRVFFFVWKLPAYDFVLAAREKISPPRIYKVGERIAFRLSPNEIVAPMGNLRWVENDGDALFQKLRPRWREYTNALDAILM